MASQTPFEKNTSPVAHQPGAPILFALANQSNAQANQPEVVETQETLAAKILEKIAQICQDRIAYNKSIIQFYHQMSADDFIASFQKKGINLAKAKQNGLAPEAIRQNMISVSNESAIRSYEKIYAITINAALNQDLLDEAYVVARMLADFSNTVEHRHKFENNEKEHRHMQAIADRLKPYISNTLRRIFDRNYLKFGGTTHEVNLNLIESEEITIPLKKLRQDMDHPPYPETKEKIPLLSRCLKHRFNLQFLTLPSPNQINNLLMLLPQKLPRFNNISPIEQANTVALMNAIKVIIHDIQSKMKPIANFHEEISFIMKKNHDYREKLIRAHQDLTVVSEKAHSSVLKAEISENVSANILKAQELIKEIKFYLKFSHGGKPDNFLFLDQQLANLHDLIQKTNKVFSDLELERKKSIEISALQDKTSISTPTPSDKKTKKKKKSKANKKKVAAHDRTAEEQATIDQERLDRKREKAAPTLENIELKRVAELRRQLSEEDLKFREERVQKRLTHKDDGLKCLFLAFYEKPFGHELLTSIVAKLQYLGEGIKLEHVSRHYTVSINSLEASWDEGDEEFAFVEKGKAFDMDKDGIFPPFMMMYLRNFLFRSGYMPMALGIDSSYKPDNLQLSSTDTDSKEDTSRKSKLI